MIVVCGEALIDVIHNDGSPQRALPGGGPFNTARALARLGVPTGFLGRLSNDAFGVELEGLLRADGASLEYATVGPEKTTIAVANVDSDGLAEYEFLVQGTSAPNLIRDMIPAEFGPEVNALHLGTLGMILEPMADTLVELADREHGKRLLMLDPNIRAGLMPDAEYRARLHHVMGKSTIVKASDTDVAWLYPGLDYKQAVDRILDSGIDVVVVTLGAEGAFGATYDMRLLVPAPQVHVVDTIGAGDAFGAALLAWLHDHDRISPRLRLDERELRAALDYACLAAAITCTRAGADPPHKWELKESPSPN